MTDQPTLPLDPEKEQFEKLWKIYRPSRRKEKMVCLAIYRKIVSPEGREHCIVRDGEKYTIHVQSTPDEIFEGCEAYLWQNRRTADTYLLHFQRFLKYGTWADMEDTIVEMKAYKADEARNKQQGESHMDMIERSARIESEKRMKQFSH